MATRKRSGQFVKGGGRKRTAAKKNAPRKKRAGTKKRATRKRARKNPPKKRTPAKFRRRAKRNPSRGSIGEVLKVGGIAIAGGVVAYMGLALCDKVITDPTGRAIASVAVPGLIAAAATQFAGANAPVAAAGALGVMAVSIAKGVSSAVLAKQNPPRGIPWRWEPNPPLPHDRLIPGMLPNAFSSPLRQ